MPEHFGYFGLDRYDGLRRTGILSDCGRYRYELRRWWDSGGDGSSVAFVMLNPSTADAAKDDATVRRCMSFAREWGHSVLVVYNLFCLRATKPAALLTDPDPVGPGADRYLAEAKGADLVVCAWGAGVPFDGARAARALDILAGKPLHCLDTTKDGHPRHPLYVRRTAMPKPFPAR